MESLQFVKDERNSNAISQVYVIWRKLYQKRFIQKSLDACDVTTKNLLTSMYRNSLTAVKACNCFRIDKNVVPADDNFFLVFMCSYDRADVWINYYLYKIKSV